MKQQQLTFEKGITNVPSDNVCSDNTLADCVGMAYYNGEYHPIQQPVAGLQGQRIPKLLYIHNYNNQKRAVGHYNGYIYWGPVEGMSYGENTSLGVPYSTNTQVTSIGKTLVITNDSGIHYFLWKGSDYLSVDMPFPEIGIEAKMVVPSTPTIVVNTGKADNCIAFDDHDAPPDSGFDTLQIGTIGLGKQEEYNDLVVGLYEKNNKEIAQNKMFSKPFFIRVALEMYDGSFIYVTNPILLFPTLTENTIGFIYADAMGMATIQARLFICQTTDYTPYSDIIKDVVVFASRGINIYDTEQDQPLTRTPYNSQTQPKGDTLAAQTYWDISTYRNNLLFDIEPVQSGYLLEMYRCLKKRSETDIINDIKAEATFFRLCSLGLKPISSFVDAATLIKSHVLENLTAQQQLKEDDFFSRNKLKAKLVYAYNKRLNISGVQRGFFNGFSFFTPIDNSSAQAYTFYVNIETDTMNVWVMNTASTYSKQGYYFFYPDPRAKRVIIKRGNTTILNAALTEHRGLNGAYYIKDTLPKNYNESSVSGSPGSVVESFEPLPNFVLTSEVNNPFVFRAGGYNAVGTGEVIAMSTVTQALSEGQFGHFPLIAFATDGIWALALNGEGVFTTANPISREICNNPKAVTQTDGAVFFTSEKGLMVVIGTNVKCVSEQLTGKTDEQADTLLPDYELGNFREFLRTCRIAYDYRDSLLWIFNNNQTCWIYAIKSGTFTKYYSTLSFDNTVNDYPDYLLQTVNTMTAYSFLEREDINNDDNLYNAEMLTRPLKLENALALKTIHQIKNIIQKSSSATVKLKLYASNNLNEWMQLNSLSGTPWKYYRIQYSFTNLKPTDTFAGSVLITEERRTNKIR